MTAIRLRAVSHWLTTKPDRRHRCRSRRRFRRRVIQRCYCEHCKIVNSLRPHDDSDSVNSVTDIADEANVRQLAESGVPVPHIHHICTDESVLRDLFHFNCGRWRNRPRRIWASSHSTTIGSQITQMAAPSATHSVPESQAPRSLFLTPVSPIARHQSS